LVDLDHQRISVVRLCELLGLAKSSFYYKPVGESVENLFFMRLLDEQYTKTPFYGVPKMTATLRKQGYTVNPKRVRRLMRKMELHAIFPKPQTSKPGETTRNYPYLLESMVINKPNQVWSTDITYIRLARGYVYLVAILDWFSRYVLSWELSNSQDVFFCLSALEEALKKGKPKVFNSDQGSQFTSDAFIGRLSFFGKICRKRRKQKFPKAGMGEGESSTISSLKDFGGRSSMKKSTSTTISP